MKLKQLFFLLFFFTIFVSVKAQETSIKSSVSLLTIKKEFVANDKVILEFNAEKETNFQLYCSNSYGAVVLNSIVSENKIAFEIPKFISKKRGTISWKTLNLESEISGNIKIKSIVEPTTIETYLGPPSIDAGTVDYTMLVVIPTDSLDNPIRDNSKVIVKHQFLKSEKKEPISTDKLIGYKNIYSPLKSGRIIISSESFGLNSKEFDVNVMPAIATNFKLFASRNHDYADGNQITTFYTSVITDQYKNIVSDGSFVEFFITNKSGGVLKTSGTTVNGIAKAKIIHPDFEEKWKVKAYFIGISESDILEINYKKIIENYTVAFSKDSRTITVGPLKSFMNQIIPDGLSIKLSIYEDEILVNNIFKESNNGFAEFYLNPNIYQNNSYRMIIETAGIKQEYKAVKLW